MIINKMKEKCCGCCACANICPKHCIEMVADHEGFLYPRIDLDQCIHCGACDDVCPASNGEYIHKNEKEETPKFTAYAAYSRVEDARRNSSSGGIFNLLANAVLDSNGIVYGAAMTKDCRHVAHIGISEKKDLFKLQGSKYLQSEIGNTYSAVKNQLEEERLVLFTGTPCQIEGLKAFLGGAHHRLICVDIICHGVPSQKVWEQYLVGIEKKKHSLAKQVCFRDKRFGWRMFSLCILFENGDTYRKIMKEDWFGQLFLQNLCLRPSCHVCAFKKVNRSSDITIADCWKSHNILKDDDKGLSLVMVHTEKGQQLMDMVRDQAVLSEMLPELAVDGNVAMYSSVLPHPKREEFFSKLGTMPIDELIKKYVDNRKTLKWRARSFVKKMKLR